MPGTLCPEVMAIRAWSRLKGYPEKRSVSQLQKSVNVILFGKKRPLQSKPRTLRRVHCGITHVTSVVMENRLPCKASAEKKRVSRAARQEKEIYQSE